MIENKFMSNNLHNNALFSGYALINKSSQQYGDKTR